MATIKKQNIRTLQKQANGSTTVALPTTLLTELKWRNKKKVVIKTRGASALIIEDWVPSKPATVKTRAGKKTTANKKGATKKSVAKKPVKKAQTSKKKTTKKAVKKATIGKKKAVKKTKPKAKKKK